jgi:AcrR family transcriptional regulator
MELNKFKPDRPVSRGERTRKLVVDTALGLFREQGYDRTTMRAIASAAGLSPGNAYYYFPSKQHLVQHFYAEIQAEHRQHATAALNDSQAFGDRLAGVLKAGLAVMAPYHAFAASFIKVAIEPGSPLSPFSDESAHSRELSVSLFRDVVDGANLALDQRLREELPGLLWLAYLGLILFWVYDRSQGQTRTLALVDAAVPVLVRLLKMSRLPVLRATTAEVLTLIRTVRP